MTIHIENQQHYDSVLAFADRVGMRGQLDDQLAYLARYADDKNEGRTRCRLYQDFSPQSFYFRMEARQENGDYRAWFDGGLLYHGVHDGHGSGSAPTFAVTLTPTTGWSIHT